MKSKHRVSKRTVLGPLLFINGLLNLDLISEIYCYADDTVVRMK